MNEYPIDITHYLPHREPFLMVDLITSMDPEHVETQFTLLPDNIFIDASGCFSESGLVENAAQTCSAIVGKGYSEDAEGNEQPDSNVIGFISAIKTLKIHSLPCVGDVIRTYATLISNFVTDDYTLCTMGCKTQCGDTVLLEGEINLFIQQQPSQPVAKSNV
ncbi:ABC transporter permease [Flavobacterium silvaticum]|uniref:ABC transporter permease n=1 Tax=Flavobacterium silvaticum TaxID=1852020 RepID=A0A972JH91_9FLAO|nr:ABC transporter permease [Flavobacterium silvaticum]NMH27690.1 ABC transporter permease [Flavobacterium silvaticum]